MAQIKQDRVKFYLDKVERKKLKEVMNKRAEFEGLEMQEVAHIVLKEAFWNDKINPLCWDQSDIVGVV